MRIRESQKKNLLLPSQNYKIFFCFLTTSLVLVVLFSIFSGCSKEKVTKDKDESITITSYPTVHKCKSSDSLKLYVKYTTKDHLNQTVHCYSRGDEGNPEDSDTLLSFDKMITAGPVNQITLYTVVHDPPPQGYGKYNFIAEAGPGYPSFYPYCVSNRVGINLIPGWWNGPPRLIEVWAGDKELVSATTRMIGGDYTYPVVLQVTDGENAINGETVHIGDKSDPNISILFYKNDSTTHWISDIKNPYAPQLEFFKGMVVGLVQLPDVQGDYWVEFFVYDSLEIEKMSDTLTFYNKGDNEASGIPPYTHAVNAYTNEILGDGLFGNDDTSTIKKDVYVEIDYVTQFNVKIGDSTKIAYITSGDISSIKDSIEGFLERAKPSGYGPSTPASPSGVDIHFDSISTILSMYDSMNRANRLALYRVRESTRAIYLILGTASDPMDFPKKHLGSVVLGFAEDYGWYFRGNPDSVGGLGMNSDSADILCAKYATVGDGFNNAQYYLNSTGCFVCVKTLIEKNTELYLDKEKRNRSIAVCAAHEIGHALGLNHWNYQYADSTKEEKNLMFWKFEKDSLDKHNFLIFEHLRGYEERKESEQALKLNGRHGLNTFNILGRNIIDCDY